jgi:hypothetical protein
MFLELLIFGVALLIVATLVSTFMMAFMPDTFRGIFGEGMVGTPENAKAMYVSTPSRKDQCSADMDCPDGTKCMEGICAPAMIDPTKMGK